MINTQQTNTYKGIAILGVLAIHLISALNIDKASPSFVGICSVIVDQLSRFSVPLFIALSGYGLNRKFPESLPSILSFYRHRLEKLLPLYLIWSTLLYLLLRSAGFLNTYQPDYTFLQALVFGKADYQFYFIPMLVQLYFLYPILWFCQRRFGSILLLLTGSIIQTTSFICFNHTSFTDQWQYTYFTPWIFYFVLGMSWASYHNQPNRLTRTLSIIVVAGSTVAMINLAINRIHQGIDPLTATKFTQLPVMVYATAIISLLLSSAAWITHLPAQISTLLNQLGRHSYLIFLSHTLIIRLLLLFPFSDVPLTSLIVVVAITLSGLILSILYPPSRKTPIIRSRDVERKPLRRDSAPNEA